MRALLVALGLCLAGPAWADVNVYYHAGGWDAFNGQGDNGRAVRGIGSRNPADGRAFSLRFEIGGDDVIFIASKPNWNIPDGTSIPVVVQIGLDRPWSQQGAGNGQRVQWTLDRNSVQTFDAQFRRASSMTVTFPSGSEQPWVIALDGSTAASNAMGRCVTDLTQRAVETAPVGAAPPASPGGTQPFSGTPTGQGYAAPQQPVQQDQPTRLDQYGQPGPAR